MFKLKNLFFMAKDLFAEDKKGVDFEKKYGEKTANIFTDVMGAFEALVITGIASAILLKSKEEGFVKTTKEVDLVEQAKTVHKQYTLRWQAFALEYGFEPSVQIASYEFYKEFGVFPNKAEFIKMAGIDLDYLGLRAR